MSACRWRLTVEVGNALEHLRNVVLSRGECLPAARQDRDGVDIKVTRVYTTLVPVSRWS